MGKLKSPASKPPRGSCNACSATWKTPARGRGGQDVTVKEDFLAAESPEEPVVSSQ